MKISIQKKSRDNDKYRTSNWLQRPNITVYCLMSRILLGFSIYLLGQNILHFFRTFQTIQCGVDVYSLTSNTKQCMQSENTLIMS